MENEPQTHAQKDLIITMDRLIASVDRLNETQKKIIKQNKIGPTLLRATFYALGSTVGLALVLAILFYILSKLGIFHSLKDFIDSAKNFKSLYSQ